MPSSRNWGIATHGLLGSGGRGTEDGGACEEAAGAGQLRSEREPQRQRVPRPGLSRKAGDSSTPGAPRTRGKSTPVAPATHCPRCASTDPHALGTPVVTVRHTGPAVLQSAHVPKTTLSPNGSFHLAPCTSRGPQGPRGEVTRLAGPGHLARGRSTNASSTRSSSRHIGHLRRSPDRQHMFSHARGKARTTGSRDGPHHPANQTTCAVGLGCSWGSPPPLPCARAVPSKALRLPHGRCAAGGCDPGPMGLQGRATVAPGHRACPAERSALGQGPTPHPWRKGPGQRLELRCLWTC